MATFTLVQVLPMQARTTLVDYLAFGTTTPSIAIDTENSRAHSDSLRALLATSSFWRKAALQCLLRWGKLDIGANGKCNLHFPLWQYPDDMLPPSAETNVRNLSLNIGFSLLASPESLRALESDSCQYIPFKAIKHLTIVFEKEADAVGNLKKTQHLHSKLRDFILRIVPHASAVHISYGQSGCYVSMPFTILVHKSFKQLYDHKNTRRSANLILVPKAKHKYLTGLTAINICSYGDMDRTCQFVRNNFETLEQLKVKLPVMSALVGLFAKDKKLIVYPALKRLIINADEHEFNADLLTIPAGSPCPKLKHLSLNKRYPLATDALLSGNSSSLEYLHLSCDKSTMRVFETCKTFANNKFAKLKYLVIHQTLNEDIDAITVDELVDLAFIKVPNTNHLGLGGTHIYSDMFTTALEINPLSRLSTLDMSMHSMDLSDMATVLDVFPYLEKLKCLSLRLGVKFESIKKEEQPAYAFDNHLHLQSNLKYIKTRDVNQSTANQAHIIMLVAIMCPSLRYVDLSQRRFNECAEYICKAAKTESFKPYSEQLSQVTIRNGWHTVF